MKKFLPLGILIVIVILFFRQFFINWLLPIPADTIVGLYHPFRDFYAKDYPRGIPFKNFLITDPIRQLYPWRNLAIELEKKMQLPLWNPYNFSGTPLLANFQTAAFYLPNILLFVFPFQVGWSVLVILQLLLGGIFMYLYLQNLKLRRAASLLGSICFIFCGFSISWLEWNSVFQVLIWVPLVLLAKDKLLQKWTFLWTLIFFFAEISAFFAGHLQTLFYVLCITNSYLFLKVYLKAKNQKRNVITEYNKIYLPFLLVGITMYAVTAIQWIPTVQFIFLSARSLDQSMWQQPGWFIPWQNLVQFLAPDFFGNPATLNYFGVWNYAELVGYIGIVPLIFSLYAIFFRRDKKTFFYVVLLGISLVFALPTPLAKLPFILHIPFLDTAQPTRLLGVIDFSLAVLSAFGFDYFLKNKKKIVFPMLFLFCTFIVLWGSVLPQSQILSHEQRVIALHNLLFPTGIFICSIILFHLFSLRKSKLQIFIIASLLIITFFDLIRFGEKFTTFTHASYLYPQTSALTFLKNNIGTYRYMTNNSEIFPPNFSIMYKLQSVDGYDPLYLQNYAELIAASERSQPNISPPFGFNRIITPHNTNSQIMNLLGVKYVLSLSDLSSSALRKVFQEGETRVYENKNVLPRVFFVNKLQYVSSKQEAINAMFGAEFKPETTAVISASNNVNLQNLQKGIATITKYSENSVQITTENEGDGFLVLTDAYYPTWHAQIDNNDTGIFLTDFALRGIFVPKGNHLITFSDSLL